MTESREVRGRERSSSYRSHSRESARRERHPEVQRAHPVYRNESSYDFARSRSRSPSSQWTSLYGDSPKRISPHNLPPSGISPARSPMMRQEGNASPLQSAYPSPQSFLVPQEGRISPHMRPCQHCTSCAVKSTNQSSGPGIVMSA